MNAGDIKTLVIGTGAVLLAGWIMHKFGSTQVISQARDGFGGGGFF